MALFLTRRLGDGTEPRDDREDTLLLSLPDGREVSVRIHTDRGWAGPVPRVRVRIDAPADVTITRAELLARRPTPTPEARK